MNKGWICKCFVAVFFIVMGFMALPALAEETGVSGTFTANGKKVELPYAYIWAQKEGFYDKSDPTWKILFVEHPVKVRELLNSVWDSGWIELGITVTAEFGDKPELQVYSQSIKFSAQSGGNISGGNYPNITLTQMGPDRFAGRIYHSEPQKMFDDTFQYDFTFNIPISDPNAPVGAPLPPGGGEPGRALVAWVEAVHAGELSRLKKMVPPDMASQFEGKEAQEELKLMQDMTPKNIKILGGSIDGEITILQVEGVLAGEKAKGEITLTKYGDFWLPTNYSW